MEKPSLGKKNDLQIPFVVGVTSVDVTIIESLFIIMFLLMIQSGISHESVYTQWIPVAYLMNVFIPNLLTLLFRPLRAMASCPLVF